MRLVAVLLGLSFLCFASPVSADPFQDVGAWTQAFKTAALKSDTEALSRLVSASTPPGVNLPGLAGMFQSVKSTVGSQEAESAEEFDEKNLGTFLKRIAIAVSYRKSFLFYGVIIGRHAEGWAVYSLKVDGNVNNIIAMPWPGYQ